MFTGEYMESAAVTSEYVYRGSEPLARTERDPETGAEEVLYLHTDLLMTARRATNSQGEAVWLWESTSFAETARNEDPNGDGEATTVNLQFPGQYYDSESMLHYNFRRYFEPARELYFPSGLIGLKGGFNTYEYVKGNPLSCSDVLGLFVRRCDDETCHMERHDELLETQERSR